MLQIAGHDVVGARGLGALQKNIVIGVGTGIHLLERFDPESICRIARSAASINASLRLNLARREHFFVFGIDIAADAVTPASDIKKARAGHDLWL
jgi:hypothetical protein